MVSNCGLVCVHTCNYGWWGIGGIPPLRRPTAPLRDPPGSEIPSEILRVPRVTVLASVLCLPVPNPPPIHPLFCLLVCACLSTPSIHPSVCPDAGLSL